MREMLLCDGVFRPLAYDLDKQGLQKYLHAAIGSEGRPSKGEICTEFNGILHFFLLVSLKK